MPSFKDLRAGESIYSTAHPYYEDEDEPEPGETKEPESEIEAPAKEVPAAGEMSAPAAEALITQEYMQRAVFFLLLLAVILYLVKRRRAAYEKLDEKSMA